jgi:hypothetical protein
MQDIVLVTNKKIVVSIPVGDLIKLDADDTVAGVVLVNRPEIKPEEEIKLC